MTKLPTPAASRPCPPLQGLEAACVRASPAGMDAGGTAHGRREKQHQPTLAADWVRKVDRSITNSETPHAYLAAVTAYNGSGPMAQAYGHRVIADAHTYQGTDLVGQHTQTGNGMQPAATPLAGATATNPAIGATGCATRSGSVSGPSVPGAVAQIEPDGTAAIPAAAPAQVQEAIAAGNQIIHTFYSQERRANMLTQVQDSYDCSGSTDFVLANAGLRTAQVDVGGGVAGDSSLLESYGDAGAGPVDHGLRLAGTRVHSGGGNRSRYRPLRARAAGQRPGLLPSR